MTEMARRFDILRKLLLTTLLPALATVVLLCAAAGAIVATGVFDVAATEPHSRVIEHLLESARERSIETRLDSVVVPPLDDPGLVGIGVAHYHEMCVTCHGAPGIERSEIGRGLNPAPPALDRRRHAAETEVAAEVYWIVKNGIWATGMPAFGPTHSDRELWAIVAFVERLPDLSPSEYATLIREAGVGPASVEHTDDATGVATPAQAAPAMHQLHHHHAEDAPPDTSTPGGPAPRADAAPSPIASSAP